MDNRILAWLAAALLASLAPGTAAAAGDLATIPYRWVFESLEAFHRLQPADRVIVETAIESSLPGVPPTDILLTMEEGGQVHEFRPDPQGRVEFPFREDWSAAGLVLQSNQPAGSLSFRFGAALKPPVGTRLTYRELMDAGRQYRELMHALAKAFEEAPPSIQGLVVQFEPGSPGWVVLKDAQGGRRLDTDAEGRVQVPDDPALWEEDPDVVLSAPAQGLFPWFK
jgi:hypothetical protein